MISNSNRLFYLLTTLKSFLKPKNLLYPKFLSKEENRNHVYGILYYIRLNKPKLIYIHELYLTNYEFMNKRPTKGGKNIKSLILIAFIVIK